MPEKIIELNNVSKKYDRNEALKDINVSLFQNDIIGVVGPNGAGKTTMIRFLCGILNPSSGKLLYKNKEYHLCKMELRKNLGYLKETTNLYNKLTVYNNVKIFTMGRNLGLSRNEILNVLQEWKLKDLSGRLVKTLSNGQRKIVSFLCSIIHNPDVILLDEPFSALDMDVKEFLRNKINMLRERERTILISSHNIDEIERTASRIALINTGRIVKEGTTDEIKRSILGTVFKIQVKCIPEDISTISTLSDEYRIDEKTNTILVKIKDEALINQILQFFVARNITIQYVGKLKLEDHLIKFFRS